MTHVAIEAVIMAPLLILLVFVVPMVATTITSYSTNNLRQVAVQDIANQMANVIQQLCSSINTQQILNGTITWTSTLPTEVASNSYTANATLNTSSGPIPSKILVLEVKLQGAENTATALATLGSNVVCNKASVFSSNSPNAAIQVQKFANDTLCLSFQ